MKALLFAAILAVPVPAVEWDFDDAVNELESRLQTRRSHVPFLGAALSIGGAAAGPLGAKDFRLAIFQDIRAGSGQIDLGRLASSWRPILRVAKRNGEQVVIYARDEGSWSHLFMLTLNRNEAVLMQFKLRPNALFKMIADK